MRSQNLVAGTVRWLAASLRCHHYHQRAVPTVSVNEIHESHHLDVTFYVTSSPTLMSPSLPHLSRPLMTPPSPIYAPPLTHLCPSPHPSMPHPSPIYAPPFLTHLCPFPHPSMPLPSSPIYAPPLTHLCPSPHPSMPLPHPSMPLPSPIYAPPLTHLCPSLPHPSMPLPSPIYAPLFLTHLCPSPHPSMPLPSPIYAPPLTHLCPSPHPSMPLPHPSMPLPSPIYAPPLTHLCPSPHPSMPLPSPIYAPSPLHPPSLHCITMLTTTSTHISHTHPHTFARSLILLQSLARAASFETSSVRWKVIAKVREREKGRERVKGRAKRHKVFLTRGFSNPFCLLAEADLEFYVPTFHQGSEN